MQEWEPVYREFANDVYHFLLYFVGNADDAEDLTNETFLRVFRNLNRFDERSSLKTWIFTIARNTAMDHFRKKERLKALQVLLKQQPPDSARLPDELVNVHEQKRELYDAIQRLNPNYRAVVILRGIQDLSPAETASILGWNEKKVNLTLHRALKALRGKMEKEAVGYGFYK